MNLNDAQTMPWSVIEDLTPGSKQRLTLTFPDAALSEISIPAIAVRGVAEGPKVAVVAGVHGGEYPGPAAAIRLAREIDAQSLTGSLVIIPMANQTAFWSRTAFVTPEDGVNLNRVFPGDADGTFSQVLAKRLFDAVIEPADVLIDLHSGDIFEALTSFSGYYAMSDVALRERSAAIAHALMLPIVNAYPEPGPDHGSLTAETARAGKVSVIAEVGCNGLLSDEDELTVYHGLINALRSMEILEGPVQTVSQRVFEPVSSADAPTTGLWRPVVQLNQQVSAGEHLGTMTDFFGDELAKITAPEAGSVVFYLTCLPAHQGETLVALGRPI
jgi:uncharacterized protein